MSGKSKQSTQSKTVVTPTNPEWVTSGVQNAASKISNIGNLDPTSLIAGINPLQQTAADSIGQIGQNRGWLDSLSTGTPSVSAASLLDGLDRYKSGYENDVVNAALADFDYDRDKTLSQLDLDMAGSQKFGGSGGYLERAETKDALGRSRTSLSANLRDQGYARAAELSNLDAQRRQSASETNAGLEAQQRALLAQLGLATEQSDRANAGAMFDMGSALRDIEAQQLNAPISLAATQAGLLSGLPLNLFQGQVQEGNSTTTSKSSNPLGALGSLAMLAAAPLTGGTSLLGMGLGGLGLGAGAGLGAAASSLASKSALGGLAGDLFFRKAA